LYCSTSSDERGARSEGGAFVVCRGGGRIVKEAWQGRDACACICAYVPLAELLGLGVDGEPDNNIKYDAEISLAEKDFQPLLFPSGRAEKVDLLFPQ